MCVPALPQLTVPVATPWQYWVLMWSHALPPTLLKNPVTYVCACALVYPPVVKPLVHCGPHQLM